MKDLRRLRTVVSQMAAKTIELVGIPFETTSELQRQVIASFVFGMTYCEGQSESLSPPETHALVLTVLLDVFKYSDHQATAFAKELIDSSGADGNSTINAIIHRGIDGHAQWKKGHYPELKANLAEVLKLLEGDTGSK